jgi:hypothetical protein
MGRAGQNPPPAPAVSRAVNHRMLLRASLLYWLIVGTILAAGCTPHPDTARRALLGLGFDSIRLGEFTLLCAPQMGVRFTARDPFRGVVSGRVCCDRQHRCEVVEDAAR